MDSTQKFCKAFEFIALTPICSRRRKQASFNLMHTVCANQYRWWRRGQPAIRRFIMTINYNNSCTRPNSM
uniref:Uncharacterized protein n=1 Tax=Rhizophora mucronata TaxID=61149 RepID=A0A2P2P3X6_RHIMU